MSTWEWLLLVAFLTLVAAYSAGGLWFLSKRVDQHEAAVREMAPASQADYTVSINDWGPDFEGTDLGRWRWVIWRGDREGAPLDVGNDISGQRAWLSVWGATVRDWATDHEYFSPQMSVEWKKVGDATTNP